MATRSLRAGRARLDLPAVGRDREVGDGDVFGLTAAVRHHRGVAGAAREQHGVERLRQRADLVDLDQDRVRHAALDALREAGGVGDEEVVADELDAVAEPLGDREPAFPVVLGHAVFDRHDRVPVAELDETVGPLHRPVLHAFAGEHVPTVVEELRRRGIERDRDLLARACTPRLRSPRRSSVERVLVRRQVGREATFVAERGRQPAVAQQAL